MNNREKLIELLESVSYHKLYPSTLASILLANGVTVQKWIPVTERLPEIARRVIVTDGENISFGYVLNYERKDWNPWCVQLPVIYNKVTHWMPLPEPPKGE